MAETKQIPSAVAGVILVLLDASPIKARDLKTRVAHMGYDLGAGDLHTVMDCLVKDGLVESFSQDAVLDNAPVTELWYRRGPVRTEER